MRAKLSKAPPVEKPNPLGDTLELLLGAAAAALTAWQQAIVAAVFELCLVGVMVIYELLGHARQPERQLMEGAPSPRPLDTVDQVRVTSRQAIKPSASPARRTAATTSSKTNSSVKSFVREQVSPADGEQVDIKALMRDYRAWCDKKSVTPVELNGFLDEIEKVCGKLGIVIEVGDDQRVYCLNVKLKTAAASTQTSVH